MARNTPVAISGRASAVRRALMAAMLAMVTLPAIAAPGAAQKAAVDAKADPVDKALKAVGLCLGSLQQLRYRPGGAADEIDEAVMDGVEALDAARAALDKTAATPEEESEADSVAERVRYCRLSLTEGALYIHAAKASAPGPGRKRYVRRALEACRGVRAKHGDLYLGMMGYLQESEIHRLTGNLRAAYVALDPLVRGKPPVGEAAAMELRRAGELAAVEVVLLENADRAIAEASALRRSPLPAGKDTWLARSEWLLARAYAASCLQAHASGADAAIVGELEAEATELLRRESVVKAAPPHERLETLMALEAVGRQIMTCRELLTWAELMAGADRPEVFEIYNRAGLIAEGPLPETAQYLLAVEWFKRGRFDRAADRCDALAALPGVSDTMKAKALQVRVAALTRRQAAAAGDAAMLERLLGALTELFDCPSVDTRVRLDALRQWVGAQSRRAGQGGCVEMLTSRSDLTERDGYLTFVLAAGLWEAGRTPEVMTNDISGRVIGYARKAMRTAEAAGRRELAARAALLAVVALSEPPVADVRGAIDLLGEKRSLLAASDATAAVAGWLRVRLMIDQGMDDEAIANLPPASPADIPDLVVQAAEILARRTRGADVATRGQVIDLCKRATQRPTDRPMAQRAARVLLSVKAHVEAETILTDLLADEAVGADEATFLVCSLMFVDALRQGGQGPKADGLLVELEQSHPRSPDLYLMRAQVKMALRRPAAAAAACRRARALTPAGSATWCRATLDLAQALRADGLDEAASDILRVSAVLHPRFGNEQLRAELTRVSGR